MAALIGHLCLYLAYIDIFWLVVITCSSQLTSPQRYLNGISAAYTFLSFSRGALKTCYRRLQGKKENEAKGQALRGATSFSAGLSSLAVSHDWLCCAQLFVTSFRTANHVRSRENSIRPKKCRRPCGIRGKVPHFCQDAENLV